MRKLVSAMSTVLLSSAMIMGCTESKTTDPVQETTHPTNEQNMPTSEKATAQDEQKALDMSLEYKKTELTVDYADYEDTLTVEGLLAKGETLKPFLTEKNYESYMANRYATLPLMVADKEKALLHPENILVEIKESKNDWILVEYRLNLVLTDREGKQLKNIPLSGDITFLQDQGEWRIQDDTYNIKDLQNIAYEVKE
ncbi:hypothetical protein [Paenibacillus sp. ACRRY]|uniref:hypothetical protein n=1 Tax=Paenibacillus sp. ACRRY TaxID=2918208 RepID=UPI001EF5044F|nr:hypothetical protein [Paenibacillus sp. ACRRY]MCG7386726.1 hypothetical protein [Paenibacillus sp. ACRRY]